MSDLIEALQKLSPQELTKVENLIRKFEKRHSQEKQEDAPEIMLEKEVPSSTPTRKKKKTREKVRGKGVQARTETVKLSGENKFLKMKERNAAKKDTETDRKLWLEREPSDRPDEYEPYQVECQVCGRTFEVHPSMVYREDGEDIYTCNRCSRR